MLVGRHVQGSMFVHLQWMSLPSSTSNGFPDPRRCSPDYILSYVRWKTYLSIVCWELYLNRPLLCHRCCISGTWHSRLVERYSFLSQHFSSESFITRFVGIFHSGQHNSEISQNACCKRFMSGRAISSRFVAILLFLLNSHWLNSLVRYFDVLSCDSVMESKVKYLLVVKDNTTQ